jgi:hypothetical protein
VVEVEDEVVDNSNINNSAGSAAEPQVSDINVGPSVSCVVDDLGSEATDHEELATVHQRRRKAAAPQGLGT